MLWRCGIQHDCRCNTMGLAIKFKITTASNSTEVSSLTRSPASAVMQFVFGVLGNLIAIIVLITANKKHKWRPFYRLVLGLGLMVWGFWWFFQQFFFDLLQISRSIFVSARTTLSCSYSYWHHLQWLSAQCLLTVLWLFCIHIATIGLWRKIEQISR